MGKPLYGTSFDAMFRGRDDRTYLRGRHYRLTILGDVIIRLTILLDVIFFVDEQCRNNQTSAVCASPFFVGDVISERPFEGTSF